MVSGMAMVVIYALIFFPLWFANYDLSTSAFIAIGISGGLGLLYAASIYIFDLGLEPRDDDSVAVPAKASDIEEPVDVHVD